MKRTSLNRNEQAFSLIEIAVVLAVMALLSGAVIPSYIRGLRMDAARKTALEMSQLSEAARAFYVDKRIWPMDISELKTQGFLDADWEAKNPFGYLYALKTDAGKIYVTTDLTADTADVARALLPLAGGVGHNVQTQITPPGSALDDPPTGSVMAWTTTQMPDGWLVCDGSTVSRVTYSELFELIGTTFGAGDGSTTFHLPDLRGRAIVGADNMGGSAANVISDSMAGVMGGVFGEEKHRLTAAEMPAHTHDVRTRAYRGGYDKGVNGGYSDNPAWSGPTDSGAALSAGGDQPHNNLQPSMALYWIIKAQ
jgi:prepilin-type N-terminal cleavage/methylation domain-containing protein